MSAHLIDLLEKLSGELSGFPSGSHPDFASWRARVQSTLNTAFDADHHLAKRFARTPFFPRATSYIADRPSASIARAFEVGTREASAVLEAAIFELSELRDPSNTADAAPLPEPAIDAELRASIGHLIEGQRWAQLASQTAIFVEWRLRKWTGLAPDDYGVSLMTAIFKPQGGLFPLGRTDAEREGWHALARGFAGALSNVDRHDIQDRDDLQRYAMGVLGTGSLLLTQLLHEHGDELNV